MVAPAAGRDGSALHGRNGTRAAQRPGRRRAAECSQQFPPSDGNCHTPLPCEVRKRERYHTKNVRSSRSGGRMLVASTLRQTFGLRHQSTDSEDRPFYSITLVATPPTSRWCSRFRGKKHKPSSRWPPTPRAGG